MNNQEKFNEFYLLGKDALDKGFYRQSLDYFNQAKELISENTRQGGDLQIWLITAYQALGKEEEAIALCQKLTIHPNFIIKKQAKDLLYILQAPRLQRPKEWMTEIPDLTKISDQDRKSNYAPIPKGKTTKSKAISLNENKLNLENIENDNNFLGFALVILVLTILVIFGGNLS